MRARSASSLRRQLAGSGSSSRRQRRYSAGYTPATPKTEDSVQRAATLFEPLGMGLRRYSIGGFAESFGSTFLSGMSRNLDSLLSPAPSMFPDQAPQAQPSGGRAQKGKAKRMNYQGVQDEEHDAHNIGKTGDQRYAVVIEIANHTSLAFKDKHAVHTSLHGMT